MLLERAKIEFQFKILNNSITMQLKVGLLKAELSEGH